MGHRFSVGALAVAASMTAGCAHFLGMHDFASASTPTDRRATVVSARGVVVDEVDGRSWLGSGTGTFVLDPGSHEFLVRFHLFEGDVVKFKLERTAVRFTFEAGKRYGLRARTDPQVTRVLGFEFVEDAPEPATASGGGAP